MQLDKLTDLKKNIKIRNSLKQIAEQKYIYFFLLPGIIWIIIFCYIPMYGITLAFKDFQISKGILGSSWVGFKHFQALFEDKEFWNAFVNTLKMSFMYILTGFPAPILLALLFNEMFGEKYKKILQTVFTFPNFISWVLVGGIFINLFSINGIVNNFLSFIGMSRYSFLIDSSIIRPILYSTAIWKGVGWGSILYLAAISGINTELYEAAVVDGASRFKRAIHITWPGIKPTAVILLILSFGGIMNGAFDQVMNMTNPVVRLAADNLDTYIYRITFQSSFFDYGFSTAVGFFKSIINFILLITADRIAKILGEGGIF